MVKNEKEENDNEEDNLNSSGELSKYTSKRSQNKSNYSPVKHSLKLNLPFIRTSKTKKNNNKKNESIVGINNQNKDATDLFTPQTPKITFENHKYSQNRIYQKRNFFKSSKMLFDKGNFNFQKSTDKENLISSKPLLNSNSSEIRIKEKQIPNKSRLSSVGIINILNNDKMHNPNISNINQTKKKINKLANKEIDEGNTTRRNFINYEKINKFLINYQKFNYHPGIFRENEELKDNCVYCVSGKLFLFLYKNKNRKEFKYLLEKIHKFCKIYYRMSSIAKSLSIDYYREYENSCICKIGECQSDFDPIMTSNVGINLRAPTNLNTILCHFYTADSTILCIKKIILEGRISYENIFLLKILSIFCTMIINSYIITCYLRHIDVIMGQLNYLEISFLILSVTGFTGIPDINIEPEPLVRNKKLFKIHYFAQIAGLIFIKLVCIYLATGYYMTNRLLNPYDVDKIFSTYYFILCTELIFSTSFSVNYISFYRKNILSNTFFMLFIVLLLTYFIILITLNSSNLRFDVFGLSYFEYFEYIIDSFDDRNRLTYFIICLIDFVVTYIYARLIYFIFNTLAKSKLEDN